MACTEPYVPSSINCSVAVTIDTKIWKTDSTTMSKIMGEGGSSWVTLHQTLKGAPKYLIYWDQICILTRFTSVLNLTQIPTLIKIYVSYMQGLWQFYIKS